MYFSQSRFSSPKVSWMNSLTVCVSFVATNETHSVQEFCEAAFGQLGLDWQKYVKHDARYERPAEVELLIGNPAKAERQLGWKPKVLFKDLVKIMIAHDLELAKREALIASLPQSTRSPFA